MNSVQTNCFIVKKLHFSDFCEYGPLDRDEKNNKTDTFVNIK